MGKNWVRILAPLIFSCYLCAFLEIEFGGRVEQSWADEYDTYTISSKVSCPCCHSFSLNHPVHPEAPIGNNLFVTITGAVQVISDISSITPQECKVFIKHEALLL
jgi:hypothetical protein